MIYRPRIIRPVEFFFFFFFARVQEKGLKTTIGSFPRDRGKQSRDFFSARRRGATTLSKAP